MKKFIFSIFVLAGVGVPLLFTPFLFSGFELGKAVLLRLTTVIAVFALFFLIIKNGRFSWIQINKKFWILLGFFVLSNVLACIFSTTPILSFWGSYERLNGLLQFLYYVYFFFLFIILIEKEEVKKLIYFLCLAGFVIAMMAILQNYFHIFLSLWDTDVLAGRVAIGTLGQPNFLASYLLMLLPFFLVFWGEGKQWTRYLWLTGLVTLTWAILLTLSRGAVFGILVSMIFMVFFYKRKLLAIPVFFLTIFVFANIFAGSGFIQNNRILNRLVLNGEGLRSADARLEIWPATLKLIQEKPILGYGQDVFQYAFEKFAPPRLLYLEDVHNKTDRAHDEILDIAASTGIIGLISYLFFLFFSIRTGVKKNKDIIVLAATTSLVAIFANNIFEFSVTINYMLWWLMIGIIVILCGEKSVINVNFLKRKWYYYFLSLIISMPVLIYTIINPVIADYSYNKGQSYASGLLYFYAADNFKKASEANPYELYYDIRGAEFALIGAKNTPEYFYKNLLLSYADSFLAKSEKLGAGDLSNVLHLKGLLMSQRNAPNLAIESLNSAIQKAPTDTLILLDLADIYVQNKLYSKAMPIYEKYLELMPMWDRAFDVFQSDGREKFLFRIFFKNNANFTDILRQISKVSKLAGMIKEGEFYNSYADKIDEDMKKLTK